MSKSSPEKDSSSFTEEEIFNDSTTEHRVCVFGGCCCVYRVVFWNYRPLIGHRERERKREGERKKRSAFIVLMGLILFLVENVEIFRRIYNRLANNKFGLCNEFLGFNSEFNRDKTTVVVGTGRSTESEEFYWVI